jgi:hypothetical protein
MRPSAFRSALADGIGCARAGKGTMLRLTLLSAAVLLVPAVAQANVIYSYIGPNFVTIEDVTPPAGTYTTAMRVTGSFEVAEALAPNLSKVSIRDSVLSFSFNDGRNTVADDTIDSPVFEVTTDAQGDIIGWLVQLIGAAQHLWVTRGFSSFPRAQATTMGISRNV